MTQLAFEYTSIELRERFKTQAVRVWIVVASIALVWIGLILSAPILSSADSGNISSPLYSFFSYICHQMPERSLHLADHPLGVCTRCFGVYFGILAGIAVYPLWRAIDEIEPLPRYWLFLSLIPIGLDFSLNLFGIWENTQLSRWATGAILGFACATFIVPASVEITRNLSHRGRGQ